MRGKLGYTFIEVIVALFLVSLGAIMFSSMLPMASKGGRMVGNYQQASSIVQHKIDECRSVGYGRLTNLAEDRRHHRCLARRFTLQLHRRQHPHDDLPERHGHGRHL